MLLNLTLIFPPSCFQDYEFQILTYKALQDPIASPLKKPKMECASDNIIQEVGLTNTAVELPAVGGPGVPLYVD